MLGFHELFLEQAESDTRTARPVNDEILPEHDFVFSEAYCVAEKCDCRRVMLNVIDTDTNEHVATIKHCQRARRRRDPLQDAGYPNDTVSFDADSAVITWRHFGRHWYGAEESHA